MKSRKNELPVPRGRSASCGGAVSGVKWFRIDAVNGTSVSSRYGVEFVYAATKLFKEAAAYATPPPAGSDSKGAALMKLVNADRKALGKSTLAIDPSLVAIARNAPLAVRETHRGLRELLGAPLEHAYRRQEELGRPLRKTEDAREGARAFLEKRAPVWKGR